MKSASMLPVLSFLALANSTAWADTPSPDNASATEFFEKEVRPIFVAKCQSCHGDKKQKGGLRLTGRAAVLQGGGRGPAIVPGKPDESLLMKAIGYAGEPKMPPPGKLSDREIAALKRWVTLGASWPEAAVAAAAAPGDRFFASKEQREWWAFQPVRPATPPAVKHASWARSEIDRFILAEQEKHGI